VTFQEQLNLYIEELSCSGRELAQNSGISETILSRYRKGERLPGADSDYLKKLAAGIALTAEQKGKCFRGPFGSLEAGRKIRNLLLSKV
jgi:transcriptional regulator with XRE-family HTH domain